MKSESKGMKVQKQRETVIGMRRKGKKKKKKWTDRTPRG